MKLLYNVKSSSNLLYYKYFTDRLFCKINQSPPISIENSFDPSRLMLTIILTVGVMQIMDGLSDSAAQDSRLYL